MCVNTASIAAFDGQTGQVAYAASKGASSMTLPAARELAVLAIRVCAIAPGLFDTPLLAALPADARRARADDAVSASASGAPRSSPLVCRIVGNPMLNGEVIRLDGALRMGPR